MTTDEGRDENGAAWQGMALLADGRRREIFTHLHAMGRPMTRDEVAAELSIPRTLAAFHLDRLAQASLVEVSFARPPGRGGPGAGRPAKRYRAVDEIEAALPHRRYRDLAGIFAAALSRDADEHMWNRVGQTAFDSGAEQAGPCRIDLDEADRIGSAARVLDGMGYASRRDSPDHLVMRNCPFRTVADSHPEVVCVLNERFVAGVVEGLGLRPYLRVAGDNARPGCCVTVTAR